jgi:two-component system, chemotaxis family, chemotaxis protein CheY
MHALVVDDSKVMRRIVAKIVTQLGFDVLEAGNGLEALEHVKDHGDTIWVALVDWTMPEMDGLEFVKAVRSLPGNDELLVMMVTAQTAAEDMQAALDAGADEYLMKPFNEESLRAKLALLGVDAA